MALEITDSNFEETVLNSSKPVLVDFWATWCGPCRMVGPIIDEISNEYEEKAVLAKLMLIKSRIRCKIWCTKHSYCIGI